MENPRNGGVLPLARRTTLASLAATALATYAPALAAEPTRRRASEPRVPLARADALTPLSPSAVALDGWLGQRVRLNAQGHLPQVDTDAFLAGYRQRPGEQAWIGEHVGKWLHAATLAWAQTGDERLHAKLLAVADALIATQEADGYLGTYLPPHRMNHSPQGGWDVWAHKYNLMGLLTLHQYTGHAGALAASVRAADLLLATFPAQRSILAAGEHLGMAATSVLEPMVLLYRITADERYLAFCRYLLRAWDEPSAPGQPPAPAVMSSLLAGKPTPQVANGKAYEMLSNLVGLVDYARLTGEPDGLRAALMAWADIVAHRLTATGSMSQWEHFVPGEQERLDGAAHIGETCVTTTWIQLNLALLQATGEARFGHEIERSLYNHLTAAQHPAGRDWCYYTPLQGRKWHQAEITCCHSSGPRALALAPQMAFLQGRWPGSSAALVVVNTLESSRAQVRVGDALVELELRSDFPRKGHARLVLHMPQPTRFALRWRQPEWAERTIAVALETPTTREGWVEWAPREWRDGEAIEMDFAMRAQWTPGRPDEAAPARAGRAALRWGPFVLAADQAHNPTAGPLHELRWAHAKAPRLAVPADGALRFKVPVQTANATQTVALVPFAEASAQQTPYRLWLRQAGTRLAPADSLLWGGRPSQSRRGPMAFDDRNGARRFAPTSMSPLLDEDEATRATTLHGAAPPADWFAVSLAKAVTVRRIVFTHGAVAADGGWFVGAPLVQIRRRPGAAWETLGPLPGYPATTALDPKGLNNSWDSHEFTLRLPAPVELVAVRVIGAPGGRSAYVGCSELAAYAT